MKIIVACFIYPLIKDFLQDFFESIDNQTYKNFDLLIFEDGFKGDYSSIKCDKIILNNEQNLSIPKARIHIINYAIDKNYELLVFCDADDILGNDRLEKIVETHNRQSDYGFYYNNLHLLDSGKDLFKGELPNEISNHSALKDYNFLGMSHTAINLKLTKNIWKNIPINDEIIAFDWYMHSYLLLKGYKGIKVNTITYYRIYDNNTAGIAQTLNEKKLKMGIKVKSYHYELMSKLDDTFKEKKAEIEHLEEYLYDDETRISDYIRNVNMKHSNFVFWWQNIIPLEEYLND